MTREVADGSFLYPMLVGIVWPFVIFGLMTSGGGEGANKFSLLFGAFFPIFLLVAAVLSAFGVGVVSWADSRFPVRSHRPNAPFFLAALGTGIVFGSVFGSILYGPSLEVLYLGALLASLFLAQAIPFWFVNRKLGGDESKDNAS